MFNTLRKKLITRCVSSIKPRIYFRTIKMSPSYKLVCLGNPLLDIQVDVDTDYLEKYGLKPNDAILIDETKNHAQIFDDVLQMDSINLIAGGAAQNTARGAQYLLPENSVLYFGSVGKDKYADRLIDANKVYGLTTSYMVQDDISTGKCAALINGQNRSLVTDLGAANHFKPSHLKANWSYVEGAEYFYIGGFHLTVSPEAIIELGKNAAESNKPFVLNFSAPFIPQFFKDPLNDVIPYTDYIICNESEAAAYAGANDDLKEDASLLEIASYIAKLPKVNKASNRTVIFTQGTDATLTVTYDSAADKIVSKEYPVHALEASKIQDTNGAGDAFAAGFMAGLVEGKTLEVSVDMGHWLAALSIQELGPSYPFPKQTYTN